MHHMHRLLIDREPRAQMEFWTATLSFSRLSKQSSLMQKYFPNLDCHILCHSAAHQFEFDTVASSASRSGPAKNLRQLAEQEHRTGDTGAKEPIAGAQRYSRERLLQKRNVNHGRLQRQRHQDGSP